MSTTEDQPAIGSPEWHRAQPPRVHTRGDLEFKRQQVWTDDDAGITYAQISLGAVDLTFLNPQHIRDLIGRLGALAGEMDAEITRQQPDLTIRSAFVPGFQPAAPVPEPECERCGATVATGGVLVTSAGVTRCHNHPLCAERVAARDAEPECERCGATGTPLVAYGDPLAAPDKWLRCQDLQACRERKAARDAEAAQVTA